jgi:hypothetical protein
MHHAEDAREADEGSGRFDPLGQGGCYRCVNGVATLSEYFQTRGDRPLPSVPDDHAVSTLGKKPVIVWRGIRRITGKSGDGQN